MTNENKINHLNMIQNTIIRMSNNSFKLKGWTISLIVAVYAVIGQNNKAVAITIIPVAMFWILDSYYLKLEKEYRLLYDEIRKKKDNEIEFEMNVGNSKIKINDAEKLSVMRIMVSKSEILFYITCMMMVVLIYYIKV
jgi:hypothetical protein